MSQKVIPHLSFTIQDNVIDYVNSFNFLCITFDCHLTWKSHIRNLAIKLSRISGILHSLRNMFPVVILQKLYVSLVCPQLTYGLLAWGSKCDLLHGYATKEVLKIFQWEITHCTHRASS